MYIKFENYNAINNNIPDFVQNYINIQLTIAETQVYLLMVMVELGTT